MKGQIWVETVIYTLIGLALMGLVLAFVMPKINESKDRIILQQTITSLNDIDEKINSVLQATGNIRTLDLVMKRGELTFDAPNNKIIFTMPDSRVLFSEPGAEVNIGRIKILTQEGAKVHAVSLTIDYSQNITFNGRDILQKLTQAPSPYKISIEYLQSADGQKSVNIATQ